MDIAVIGAGPAGLMAALAAAESKEISVTVFEKNDAPGRKLLMTGGGRCNITHLAYGQEWLESYYENGKFLFHSFSEFGPSAINKFFERCGLEIVSEKDGRCFPKEGKSKAVLNALLVACEKKGVKFEYGHKLMHLNVDDQGGIRSVCFLEKEVKCHACILAVGGMSYPSTGSSGDGYEVAREWGHRIVLPRTALAPIRTSINQLEGLAGVSCQSVGISLWSEGKRVAQTIGDILYTHEGLSGPGIMRISRYVPEQRIIEGQTVQVVIDFLPSKSHKDIQDEIFDMIRFSAKRNIYKVLKSSLRNIPIAHILKEAEIQSHLPCGMVQKKQLNTLLSLVKAMPYAVTHSSDFNQAMVTAGGIDLKDIHPKTMASRRISGLYFAGEIMNIDGDTGGYNLQAAFSTGFVAGCSAARRILEGHS